MSTERFIRWQGLVMAQLSVAVALISALSVAGLGAGLTLLQDEKFMLTGWWKSVFSFSQLLFAVAAFLSCGAIITRLLDFRLTARSVRPSSGSSGESSLTIFGCDSDGYGRATWRLFWPSCFALLLASVLLIVSVGIAYSEKLH